MLMGLPIGWVMPSCKSPLIIALMSSDCWVMESFPIQHAEPSKSCGEKLLTMDELIEINEEAIRLEAPDLDAESVSEEAAFAALEQWHEQLERF